jgi:acetyltransferase EpsM
MEKNRLLIFGAGGHAIKVSKIAEDNKFTLVGYISTEKPGEMINGAPVLGYLDFYKASTELHEYNFHIAIGENFVRNEISNSVKQLRDKLISIISVHSIISRDSSIGAGTFVAQNAVIQNNITIGYCCIIDTGSIVDHDTSIGDYVNISPGSTLCSHIEVGNGAVIGAGSTVIEKVSIGDWALIGAGSVVLEDVAPYTVVAGNPARPIKKRRIEDKYLK